MIEDILLWPFMIIGGIVAFIVGLIVLIFWILMIVDCARRKFKQSAEKVLWIAVMIFGTWIGAVAYYFVIPVFNPKGIFKENSKRRR